MTGIFKRQASYCPPLLDQFIHYFRSWKEPLCLPLLVRSQNAAPTCGADKLARRLSPKQAEQGRETHTYCKPCDSQKSMLWARNNRRRHLGIRRKYRFGITVEHWEGLFETQGRKCAICMADNPGGKSWWHTDHCHKTNKVRGILCAHCNRLLGGARDNIKILESAMNYLSAARKSL